MLSPDTGNAGYARSESNCPSNSEQHGGRTNATEGLYGGPDQFIMAKAALDAGNKEDVGGTHFHNPPRYERKG